MKGMIYTLEEIENIFKNYIGTDESFDVNVYDSYIMAEEPDNFERNLDIDLVQFFCCPDKNNENEILCILDACQSFDELVEIYENDKQSIDSYCETFEHINFKEPTFYDFLGLASDCVSWLYS